jgi:hypothetical protein
VGAIVRGTTPADLARIYGAANVRYADVPAAEGQKQRGAFVLRGTASELKVGFTADGKRIEFVAVVGRAWATKEGLRIGTSLAELERINGGPFELWGFSWDYGGSVFARGAALEGIFVGVAPTMNQSSAEAQQVMGRRKFSSRHPAFGALDVVVHSITIVFDP